MEQAMETMIETAVVQHGFAIAVAVFLLLRTDKRLEEIRDALIRLTHTLEKGHKP